MPVTVREIHVSSESEISYFLQVEWKGRDLGSGFLLMLTDGQNSWRGEVSEDAVMEEAEELEMQTDRYIQDLQEALTGTGSSSSDYSFTLTSDPSPGVNMTLAYEKVQMEISFRLGSVLLCEVPEPVEEVRTLLTHGLELGTKLQKHNQSLKEENHRLKQELQHINAEMQRYVKGKETLESELYSRFVLVLNEKKAKIRCLKENITHLEETREDRGSSSGKRMKQSTVETREEEEDMYGASTDEEEPASTTNTKGMTRSHSPLDSSPNDITDVAPCRKRRLRHLQPPETVATRPITEPAPKPRRAPPPSSRAAANKEQRSTDVSPDAEDLFEDF
ncbi:DNA repair protein XRCC4 isoform X2 [Esox lucius]|nr:DNA repair protein XRCC4 isoform X2 [Esox lucius]XP_019908936.2 DNA repair protein XRCC4 isoform X2 [Esox lucius]XP_034152980.1 DNA repair protein XRCC4 isoform X2 [Esox lucius]